MTLPSTVHRRRPSMRRAVVLFPSGLTLGNLFFGVFAIITASRGDFRKAGIYVLLGGICDALDGRVARATNAGSEFGEELDSLVDAIAFGLAPAMIMYFAVLNRSGWDWIFVFLFVACAVMRLARFNVEQAGTTKTYFQGLPSPAAGITLASYYWFSQSWLYSYGAIGDLPWQEMMRFLMAGLGFLMISPIPYPVLPRTGFRSLRALGSSVLVFGSIALLLSKQLEYFFPLCIGYVLWGPVRNLFTRLFERRQPTIPYDLSEGEDEEEEGEPLAVAVPAVPVRPVARGLRATREERSKLQRDRSNASDAEDREERPARIEKPGRTERPERTDAERAARREKREKRDKREGRGERQPKSDQQESPAVADAIAAPMDASSEVTQPIAPSSGDLLGQSVREDSLTPALPSEGASPRKRKRRRRRGERKERSGSDTSAIVSEQDAGDDGGADDSSYAEESERDAVDRSPYSTPPMSPPALPMSLPVSLPVSTPVSTPVSMPVSPHASAPVLPPPIPSVSPAPSSPEPNE